ncbi:hypothetical protein K439DRAFT_361348 [Ramaria rubella]|nr:hypothetical protein K439DRAFT_361348 [Ramaria rubella]
MARERLTDPPYSRVLNVFKWLQALLAPVATRIGAVRIGVHMYIGLVTGQILQASSFKSQASRFLLGMSTRAGRAGGAFSGRAINVNESSPVTHQCHVMRWSAHVILNLVEIFRECRATDLRFHLLFARRDATSERARYTARISILESLICRSRKGGRIDADVDKLLALSRKLETGNDNVGYVESDKRGEIGIPWREVLLGRHS